MSAPLSVACPRCGSAVEQECFSVGPDSYNRGAPLKRPHPERYAAAGEAARAEESNPAESPGDPGRRTSRRATPERRVDDR